MPLFQITSRRLLSPLSLFAVLALLTGPMLAQQTDATATATATDSTAATDNGGGSKRQRSAQQDGETTRSRRNFDPAQFQQQMMDRMREQFGVTDDAEWKVISDRVTAVMDARRAVGGGFGIAALRAARSADSTGGRRGIAASPEQDALRQAITDNLPDAEIKARLERLREVRKTNEEKLSKAQDDLRAVLNVRQEAVAVMVGFLP